MGLRVVQTNLNHHAHSHDMLEEFIRAEGISVALVSDPYHGSLNGWLCDSSGGAVMGVFRPGLSINDVEVGDGYVCATVGGSLRVYSCYARPPLSAAEFERFLFNIMVSVAACRGRGLDVIVAGDFNAHSAAWGDRTNDVRGESLCALAASLGLAIANVGREPTFFLRGRGSIVDVTLVSESASGRLREWRVRTDCENLSDHHHITFSYTARSATSQSVQVPGGRRAVGRRPGWSTARMDADLLAAAMVVSEWTGAAWSPDPPPQSDDAEVQAERLVRCVTAACDIALPPRRLLPGPPVYWWNGKIAAARTECVRQRWRFTRLRGRRDRCQRRVQVDQMGAETPHPRVEDEVLGRVRPLRGERPLGEALQGSSGETPRAIRHLGDGAAHGAGHRFDVVPVLSPPP